MNNGIISHAQQLCTNENMVDEFMLKFELTCQKYLNDVQFVYCTNYEQLISHEKLKECLTFSCLQRLELT